MYDRRLDSFVKVVESGSFAQAGGELFVSANALIKQVNCLERDLGVRLFERGNRGVVLTAAGQVVYRGALRLMGEAREIVSQARLAAGARPQPVRLAASLMRPARRIGVWWAEVADAHPLVSLEIVQVTDDIRAKPSVLARLGEDIDAVVTIDPLPGSAVFDGCTLRPLFSSPACLAIPVGHRLAGRDSLGPADLAGEKLYVTARGYNAEAERIRDELSRVRPPVTMVDCAPYDLGAFNEAARERALVLHCEELGEAHPSYVNIPLVGHAFLFCLVHRSDCPPAVREFAEAICVQAKAHAEMGAR